MRPLKAEFVLLENIRALLVARRIDAADLAFGVGHSQPWISKILSGDRKMSLADIDKVAAFFGLTASQLLSHGIGSLTERRHRDRRSGQDRRKAERRKVNIQDVVNGPYSFRQPGMPKRNSDDEEVA